MNRPMQMQASPGTAGAALVVLVRSVTWLARDTIAVEFVREDGAPLPAFSAGAHLDLILPNGIRRSYSLCSSPAERHHYVVGVKRASPSRGASVYLHDTLRVGQTIRVSEPRNNFPLDDGAARSVLIAGGIGITPMMAMIDTLEREGRDWRLYYACRTRADAAFLDRLDPFVGDGRVRLTFDGEPGGRMLDIGAVVADETRAGVHFYACGPAPMLDAFEAATAGLPPECRHLERFGAAPKPVSDTALDRFEVELARSGLTLEIGPGENILDALLDNGIDLPFSCMEGVCGSCRVGVIEGTPDHRDMVLSDDEMAANTAIMVCCSGSRSDRLVLDI